MRLPIVQHLEQVLDALVRTARLQALALLAAGRIVEKQQRALALVERIEQAASLEEFLLRYFQVRPRPVAWAPGPRPDELAALAHGPSIEAELETSTVALAGEVAQARAIAATTPLCAPVELQLAPWASALPAPPRPLPIREAAPHAGPPAPTRALRGPKHVPLDPIFAPTFSLLRPENVAAMGSHRAPFYWCLGLREAMASELCALSIIEYDGLPLTFYRDFAKQAWDETRHAAFFLSAGIELAPEFARTAPPDHPLLPGARRFLESGEGLPVPLEGGLYEVIWNATLEERLVLMHLDTETPGIATFTRELRSELVQTRPSLALELELSRHDEISHARLGKRWIDVLLPNPAARQDAIKRTRLLRGVLVLAGMAHSHHTPLAELLRSHART